MVLITSMQMMIIVLLLLRLLRLLLLLLRLLLMLPLRERTTRTQVMHWPDLRLLSIQTQGPQYTG